MKRTTPKRKMSAVMKVQTPPNRRQGESIKFMFMKSLMPLFVNVKAYHVRTDKKALSRDYSNTVHTLRRSNNNLCATLRYRIAKDQDDSKPEKKLNQ